MVKSVSFPDSSRISYLQIVLVLFLFLFASPASSFGYDLASPSFLTAISEQDVNVPLFWFSPHPETAVIALDGGRPSSGLYVWPAARDNCLAVRMSSSSIPFYLLESRVYVMHHGLSSDASYDYKTPFFVTVNRDSGGVPQNRFINSVSAAAGGEDSLSEGEWVPVPHNLLMQDSVFWIVFHWKENSPTSPLVGVDGLSNVGSSFWGKRTFFHFEWHPCEHNIMIRAEIVTNSKTSSDADSFRIYRSTDQSLPIEQSNLIASIPPSRFEYIDYNVTENETYFYRVTSFDPEGESEESDQSQATPKRKAELVPDRERFLAYLDSGVQVPDNLNLTNSGGLPLTFRARVRLEQADWMGGSDSFGYNWTDNHRQPELEFRWVDIKNRGILIGQSGDDNEVYGFFDLGFPFPFYGNAFDRVRISSDGWLSFSDIIPCYTDSFLCWLNKPLPYLWGPYDLLAPFWDDLKLIDSSAIYFYSSGDSAVISCLNLHHPPEADRGPYTFQTILTRDGEIAFQYFDIDDSLYSATVGIQNHDGTEGLKVLYNQRQLHDSLVIKIRPSWVRIDSMAGCIQPGESRTLNLTFDRLSYPKGVYHADLLIDSWDKNQQLEPLIIPLTLCIDTTIDTSTSVDWVGEQRPEDFALLQNYPNPFNPTTTIKFKVQGSEFKVPIPTTLKIYNVLGQRVRTLVDEQKTAGNYEVVWDGKDDRGKELASGIYFCKLTAGSYQKTRKMLLLR
ncbi:MAG: FlgD immunoglobulin-like domain containing protein [Candidatus Zixiibacteriota bacterium]